MSVPFTTRKNLFERQKGRCHWCGHRMILEKGPADGIVPARFCTADHLVDRWDARNRDRAVAACFSCNTTRNDIKQKRLPKDAKSVRVKQAGATP